MADLAFDAVVQEVLDYAGSESETAPENDDVVPDIGREEVVQSSTTRKRRRDPSQWTRNANKLKRARGEEYVNRNPQIVSAKMVGHPCKCKRKCFEKIGEDKIKAIFDGFLQLSDKDKQDAYLFSLISCSPVMRRRPRFEDSSMHRSASYYYRVKAQSGDVVVCKHAFLSIHGITAKRLRRLCEHAASGSSTPPTDKRGKHSSHHRIDPDLVKQVKDHIESFPAQESHYSRSDNHGKLFLSENLSIRCMYHLYLEMFEPEQYERIQQGLPFSGKVKEHFYR